MFACLRSCVGVRTVSCFCVCFCSRVPPVCAADDGGGVYDIEMLNVKARVCLRL
jgi:hypothetical protein